MYVQVKKVEKFEGTRERDGQPYKGASVLMIFEDKKTALQTNIFDEVIDPDEIEVGKIYDMYRSENGRVLVFEKFKKEGETH